jgi:hypothetical protein
VRIPTDTLVALLFIISACGGAGSRDLVLHIDDRCSDTATFKRNLDAMLEQIALDPRDTYELVDLTTLLVDDVRRAYPAPTLLYRNRDFFGNTENVETFRRPSPPLSRTSTCRLFPGGVPSSREVSDELSSVRAPDRHRLERAHRVMAAVADYSSVILDVGARLVGRPRPERYVY